jgi:hypothetical protein
MAIRNTVNDDQVYQNEINQLGKQIENNFYHFLVNFELNPEDPNYDQYADGFADKQDGEPIKYYQKTAERMREQEKVTMYIDFSHLSQFNHRDQSFMQTIVHYFYKYEPNLRDGLTRFMQ